MKYLNNIVKIRMLETHCQESKNFSYSTKFKEQVLKSEGLENWQITDLTQYQIDHLSLLLNRLNEGSPKVISDLLFDAQRPYNPVEVIEFFENGNGKGLYEDALNRRKKLELVDSWLDSEFEAGHFKFLNAKMVYLDYQETYFEYYKRQREKNKNP